MSPSPARTVMAGVAAGLALAVTMLLTFRLIGFGWNGDGFLLDPELQSGKVIAVWTRLEPLPLVTTSPAAMLLGFVLFAVGHAFVYRWLSPSWPAGVAPRAARIGALVFFLSFVWFEFFTPFNLFGEPLGLVLIELVFWALVAAAEALMLAAIMERRP